MYITATQATFLKELLQRIESQVYAIAAQDPSTVLEMGDDAMYDIILNTDWVSNHLHDLVSIREAAEYWETTNSQ